MPFAAPVVVIGGGHAGVEAAHAAARIGVDVILVTHNPRALVRLSCNPAVGGIGKGHLVREIDALGGVMGLAADRAGIHFRVLNRRKGPAVHGPRAQQDHDEYPRAVQELTARVPRITLVEGEVATLLTDGRRVAGVETLDGRSFPAAAVVLTTGTFLRGRLFRGDDETPGGRVGEPPAEALSGFLRHLGLRLERFKTGTPPRIDRTTIDYAACERQPGDDPPEPMSFQHFAGDVFEPRLPQLDTHLAYTNESVHTLVRENLHLSPLYAGRIRAKGPRYCPSFEDKVVRFADRDRHLLHLEPMGVEHPWVYINGFSTSLPAAVQEDMVHQIQGLERARVARHGYAVEYDYAPPTQLRGTLETRALTGLFLAGQICGTTGYEEAAGLGLVAGANAALAALGREPWAPDRLSSYIGVMVDDLTTRGVLEPYRMFTSRAEVRLSLAPDGADRRLTPLGVALGLVPADRSARTELRWGRIDAARAALEGDWAEDAPRPATPADRIRRGEDPLRVVAEHGRLDSPLPRRDLETLVALIRYRGYLSREEREVERLRSVERLPIPADFDFSAAPGLSTEVKERLVQVRPASLGQAARIPGLTPAAVGLLAAAISQRRGVA